VLADAFEHNDRLVPGTNRDHYAGLPLAKEVLKSSLASWGRPNSKCLYVESATRLNTEYVTLAEMLKQAGYATGHFGKWHLGAEPYSPLQQGFDVDIPHWPGPGLRVMWPRGNRLSSSCRPNQAIMSRI